MTISPCGSDWKGMALNKQHSTAHQQSNSNDRKTHENEKEIVTYQNYYNSHKYYITRSVEVLYIVKKSFGVFVQTFLFLVFVYYIFLENFWTNYLKKIPVTFKWHLFSIRLILFYLFSTILFWFLFHVYVCECDESDSIVVLVI